MSDYGTLRPGPRGARPRSLSDAAEILAVFDDLLAVQCNDGNWNYDPYMHGMANGMILTRSVVSGEEPRFLDAPSVWLSTAQNRFAEGQRDGAVFMAAALDSRNPAVARAASFFTAALQADQFPQLLDDMSDADLFREMERINDLIGSAVSREASDEEMHLLHALVDAARDEAISRGYAADDIEVSRRSSY